MADASAMTRDSRAPERAIRFVAQPEDEGRRLDVVLAEKLPNHSRTALKNLVKKGAIVVDGGAAKPSHVVEAGQVVSGTLEDDGRGVPLKPEAIPFGILYEDATVLVLDKPAGLVVHPGSGQRDGTLANALAHHAAELSDAGGADRPGIVHRLDRDTSGVMVVAKSNAAHFALATQFHDRQTKKEYRAIVEGEPEFDGDLIRKPLGRARHDPARVTVDAAGGKAAETAWEVLERFEGFTYIRVHLQSIGHPVVCDGTYGRRERLLRKDLDPSAVGDESAVLERQALHAFALEFHHPLHGKTLRFEAPLPQDFEAALAALRHYRRRKVR
jgi:23S rRNA pseudouridine1911/1915/1917 synthase